MVAYEAELTMVVGTFKAVNVPLITSAQSKTVNLAGCTRSMSGRAAMQSSTLVKSLFGLVTKVKSAFMLRPSPKICPIKALLGLRKLHCNEKQVSLAPQERRGGGGGGGGISEPGSSQ